jgi:hypothetical protein
VVFGATWLETCARRSLAVEGDEGCDALFAGSSSPAIVMEELGGRLRWIGAPEMEQLGVAHIATELRVWTRCGGGGMGKAGVPRLPAITLLWDVDLHGSTSFSMTTSTPFVVFVQLDLMYSIEFEEHSVLLDGT